MMLFDPTLIGLAVTVNTNPVTSQMSIAGMAGVIRGVGWENDRTGTYALFLIGLSDGTFVTLEGGNTTLAPTVAPTTPTIPGPTLHD